MNFSHFPSITILGYGREGQSTYRFLIGLGYDPDWILVRDKNYDGILEQGGAIISGDGYLQGIENDHLIFRAPGITTTMLAAQGVDIDSIRHKLTSQTEYFLQHYTGRVIGVTGTKGKSTTSTLLSEIIRASGKSVLLAGNVGKPIFDLIDFNNAQSTFLKPEKSDFSNFKNPVDYVVYEMSSYMLESLNHSDWLIDYGMITSLFPHVHVKEHGSQEAYIAAKMEMILHSKNCFVGSQVFQEIQNSKFNIQKDIPTFGSKGDSSLPQNDQGIGSGVFYHDGRFWRGSEQLFETSVVQLLGEHNLYNICGVIAVALDLGIKLTSIEQTIRNFQGLEHRLEYVGNYGEIERYNDAIATTPDATVAAMKSFGEKLGTLFLGGVEGPYQFHTVVEYCKLFHVENVILFPDTGARIKELLQTSGYQGKMFNAGSMQEAVEIAYAYTPLGNVALLSCGSPSFSLWKGFEEKGRLFKESIQSYGN